MDKPNTLSLMTGYRDEDDYNSFTAAMKENARYQELSDQLSKERESIEVTTLKSVIDMYLT
ncbi:MAG: hypothetical protein IH840_03300 [Candidatus Heimdallarchaeota archaeon]|nr:hypothetical protein [Candidatus Heimdallarchaeota archaeon]